MSSSAQTVTHVWKYNHRTRTQDVDHRVNISFILSTGLQMNQNLRITMCALWWIAIQVQFENLLLAN